MADRFEHGKVGGRVGIGPRAVQVEVQFGGQPSDGFGFALAVGVELDVAGVAPLGVDDGGGGDELVDSEVFGEWFDDLDRRG